jgi:tRNA(adenine34) deaminase
MNDFEKKVSHQIEQLKNEDFQTIELKRTKKRISWLNQTLKDNKDHESFTPREAFELLFFENMELKREELPVITESNKEIVWLSYNRCPTLEACNKLGFDTREVCRSINEKSTQAFISQLNPQLRFHRDYGEIRPYAEYCKEKIIRIDFNDYMRIAIQEALISKSNGNKGYGAVVVFDDQIIGQAHDTSLTEKDPSLHAEVNAIRQAVKTIDDNNLCGAILFSTCEPCPMCTSLSVWANMTTIVYGISIEETAESGRSRIQLSTHQIIEKSPCVIEVIGNILHDECKMLYL